MQTLTDHQRGQLPAGILRWAATTTKPDACMALFYLTRHAGHSIASAARELDVPYRTACNWAKRFEQVEDQVQTAASVSSTVKELTADDVVQERRRLFDEAKRAGKLDLQQRLLADEAKRHGLEISRVEQTSVVVQLQQLAPEARAAEIAARLSRLNVASLPGGSPPAGALAHVLEPTNPYKPILEDDVNASPSGEDGDLSSNQSADVSEAGDASSVSDTSDTAAQE